MGVCDVVELRSLRIFSDFPLFRRSNNSTPREIQHSLLTAMPMTTLTQTPHWAWTAVPESETGNSKLLGAQQAQ